jgi:hypothetical protein
MTTMFTDHDLVKLWANDQKRREFVKDYKTWGVWFEQPELDLTYYKYDLPGGGRLIAMEYLREPYASERYSNNGESIICKSLYLQRGKHFNPFASSDAEIASRLKDVKENLSKEQRQRNRQCGKCGGRSIRHKSDGSVHCTSCLALVA